MSQLLTKLKNIGRSVKRKASRSIDPLLPYTRKKKYYGYKLFFSRGTSLIDRIERDGNYEDEVCRNIVESLNSCESKVFVDIGANIGLISLRMLREIPRLKIYAFEPGPHQHQLFSKTINENALQDKISLSNLALSDTSGVSRFATHSSEHVSGDGFKDTGRAGKANYIKVSTETLDNWWEKSGKPNVSVMKIDTEGAELLILKGGHKMLKSTRPILYIEIWEPNLEAYPYSADDIFNELSDLGYTIKTQTGEEVLKSNRSKIFEKEADYIAYPKGSKR